MNGMNQKKICILGMFGVGKTSLVERFVYNKFDDEYKSTIGIKVCQKLLSPIETDQHKIVQFNFLLWDIEGAEVITPQIQNYMIGAHGALIVSDLTRPDSISVANDIVETFQQTAPDMPVVLAGNKFDLIAAESENIQQLEELGETLKAPVLLTSAKENNNVEAAFEKLGLLIASS